MEPTERITDPLTSRQRTIVWAVALAIAVTRVWGRAATLWDWDEVQFCLGVRAFDVVLHHPHPPGFPLYMALGKIVGLLAGSEFRALQAVVVAASIALFPLLFAYAREAGFPFRTALAGALLFVFLPNVWFYGETIFSDIPAIALVLAACVALLRGRHAVRWYYAGALLLGLAAAIRPQALIIGATPALVATVPQFRRSLWRVAFAVAIGAAVVGVAYAAAAISSSSVDGYMTAVRNVREYVAAVDSFRNPVRPALRSLAPAYFVHVVPGGRIVFVLSAASALALLASRHRKAVWLTVATFLPFNLFAWLMLDVYSVSRYSVAYVAMYALLAADGLDALATRFANIASPRVAQAACATVLVAIAVRFAWWTAPAVDEARRTPSPPASAMEWIRSSVKPGEGVYAEWNTGPWRAFALPGRQVIPFRAGVDLPDATRATWAVSEGNLRVRGTRLFARPRGRSFDIVRHRYFEMSVAPSSNLLIFGRGWYEAERDGETQWRWMAQRSETLLPALNRPAMLSLAFAVPSELLPQRPVITVRVDGQLLDRLVCSTERTSRAWRIPTGAAKPSLLVIETSATMNPKRDRISDDARDLGLELLDYSWESR